MPPPLQDLAAPRFEDAYTWKDIIRGEHHWYQYSTAVTVVAAGTVAAPIRSPALIEIDIDSFFFAREITGVFMLTTNLEVDFTTTPQPLIELFGTGAGNLLIDRETYWENIVGVAERPYKLKMPMVFYPRDQIRVVISNRAAAVRNWQVTFTGTRLYVQ